MTKATVSHGAIRRRRSLGRPRKSWKQAMARAARKKAAVGGKIAPAPKRAIVHWAIGDQVQVVLCATLAIDALGARGHGAGFKIASNITRGEEAAYEANPRRPTHPHKVIFAASVRKFLRSQGNVHGNGSLSAITQRLHALVRDYRDVKTRPRVGGEAGGARKPRRRGGAVAVAVGRRARARAAARQGRHHARGQV